MPIRYGLPGGLKGTYVPNPKPDDNGFQQSGYFRAGYNLVQSSDLQAFHRCVASKLEGKSFANRGEVRQALAAAAKACKIRG